MLIGQGFKEQIKLKIASFTILFLLIAPSLKSQITRTNDIASNYYNNIAPPKYNDVNPLVLSNIEKKPDGSNFLNRKWSVDLFFYPQFRFKNAVLTKMYLIQANINPTIHFNMWRGAAITTQLIFPAYNDYSSDESKVRPGFITFSQQFNLLDNFQFLATVGNFNMQRAGVDVKFFKNITNIMGIYGQVGVTNWSLAYLDNWYFSDLTKVNWRAGINYFLKSKNVLINLNVSKYLEDDIALRGEVIRYFKNASIGFYLQTLQYEGYTVNGGFFFTILLPPRNKGNRRIRVSTSEHFSLEYMARPYTKRGVFYKTAPDENSSFNFFNKSLLNYYK